MTINFARLSDSPVTYVAEHNGLKASVVRIGRLHGIWIYRVTISDIATGRDLTTEDHEEKPLDEARRMLRAIGGE